jgi:hypothetical protein
MKYLKVFTDFADAVSELGDAEIGRLFMAMMKYAATNELSELRGNERFVWPTAKMNIDREIDYCAQQRENGKLGGRPKSHGNPNKANESRKSQKDKDKDKDIITPSIISPAKFKPPTVDDVQAYCQERRNKVDAQTFVDFYTAKGWKVGSQSMKDWQAAVRTWEKRVDKQGDKPVKRAHNHSTRNYTPEELSAIGRDLLEEV